MQIYEIVLIGLVLAIDACAVTIANCSTHKNCLTKAQEWSMPITFAIFQGVMPLIGYLVGSLFSSVLASITKYLTATIFFILAVKIIADIIKENKEQIITKDSCKRKSAFTLSLVILQAVATSIDALAIGVTFIDLTFSVFIAVSIIAGVTFLLVTFALFFGKTLGKIFGKYAEWVGAGILLLLAVKAFLEALGVL